MVMQIPLTPISSEVITVDGVSIGLTAGEITPLVRRARVTNLKGSKVYYRNTGVAEDEAETGEFPLDVGDVINVWGTPAMRGIRFIRRLANAKETKLNVQYDGEGG